MKQYVQICGMLEQVLNTRILSKKTGNFEILAVKNMHIELWYFFNHFLWAVRRSV